MNDEFNFDEQNDQPIERAIDDEPEQESHKAFYIIVAAIVLLFGGLVAYQQLSNTPTGAVTFDDLHRLNLEGKLDPDRGYVYNGFSFVLFDGLWYTNVDVNDKLYRIPLHFGPRDLENVTAFGELGLNFNVGEEVYITISPNESGSDYVALAASELAQNMVTAIHRAPIGSCDRNETAMCETRPIVTCDTTDKPMVYLLNTDTPPEIELNGQCITVRGKDYDLVRAVDFLILRWYNVFSLVGIEEQ
ncbi:MAG TPA: hypothetical protein VJB66_01675 [Candidatus Nanoarchaeia archaeon]|nr:hypothetical protein [Candidatus Nanoarchaeia archaeon]